MTLEQARCVVEVAACGTLREAANNLYVSASAVSQAISSLEKELNIQIFSRSRTGSTLTATGASIYALCAKITKDVDNITRLAQASIGTHRSDIVRIGFCNYNTSIDPLITELAAHSAISLHYCAISDMEYLLNNGFLDIAFCTGVRSTLLRHKQEFSCQLIHHDDLLLAMRPENPLAKTADSVIQPENLQRVKWCFLNPDLDSLLASCIPNYNANSLGLSTNHIASILEAIRKTDLVSLLPPALIPDDLISYHVYLSEKRAPRTYNYLLYCPGLSDNDSEKNRHIYKLSEQISSLLRASHAQQHLSSSGFTIPYPPPSVKHPNLTHD